jgi:phospholipase/lecithinase/hemolysin
VLDLYRTQYVHDAVAYPNYTSNPTYQAVMAELQARGARLGQQINDLTALGPKVILSTMPLMNLTPYALQEAINKQDQAIRSVLLDFSNQFNTAMRVNIINDGRWIGLVELDALLNAGVSNPQNYGLTNTTAGVCAVELPNCTTNTLVTGGNATTWLWASNLWMGSTAHLNLGNFARGRALGNPFGSEARP